VPDNFTKRLRRPSAAFLRRFSDGQNTVLQIACFEHIRVGVAFCGKRAKLVSMILLGEKRAKLVSMILLGESNGRAAGSRARATLALGGAALSVAVWITLFAHPVLCQVILM